jgi:hypothetical protein
VALAWTAPASDGGSPISGYTATAMPGGATCSTANLGCTISGLANGTAYSFSVVAINAVGPSLPSNSVPATPDAALPTTDLPGVQGDWVGNYGTDGYVLGGWNGTSGDLSGLPAGITYTLEQGSRAATWPALTTDVRALESPSQAERRARTWYHAVQVRVRLDFTSAYSGTLHLYALDWDSNARRQDVTVDDGAGPRTVNLTAPFNPGAWLHFPITVPAGGSVLISVDTRNAAVNGVLSGLFLGEPGTAPPAVPDAPTGLTATPGETVSRMALAGNGEQVSERAVDVQVNRLRRKIEANPANPLFVQTVRGIGYRLVSAT